MAIKVENRPQQKPTIETTIKKIETGEKVNEKKMAPESNLIYYLFSVNTIP